jgi:enterochelin esterase family protein
MSIRNLVLGPVVTGDVVKFSREDNCGVVQAVQLLQEIQRPRAGPHFQRVEGGWALRFPRPDVDRMEYRFELQHPDGGWEGITDPDNPLRAPGPFGERSVVEFPHYVAPSWLKASPPPGETLHFRLPSPSSGGSLPLRLWTSPGGEPEDALPLLVAHDGLELDQYGGLSHFLATMVDQGRLPPHRVALLGPHDRDQTYSAAPTYVQALARDVLPVLAWLAPSPSGHRPVGLGASLGGLALLHAHRSAPQMFSGLYLQSASCFRRADRHETGFARYRRISRFVEEVLGATAPPRSQRVPVAMTCGTVEENLPNNRAVATALARQGYDITLHVNRDAHNWSAWRDTWDPHLTDLLARCWSVAERDA